MYACTMHEVGVMVSYEYGVTNSRRLPLCSTCACNLAVKGVSNTAFSALFQTKALKLTEAKQPREL